MWAATKLWVNARAISRKTKNFRYRGGPVLTGQLQLGKPPPGLTIANPEWFERIHPESSSKYRLLNRTLPAIGVLGRIGIRPSPFSGHRVLIHVG